jgi:hypothetical protein
LEKKHNVSDYTKIISKYKIFTIHNDEDDNDDNDERQKDSKMMYFHCLLCDKKKTIDLLFGHYAFYHTLSIHSLKKCIESTPNILINGSVINKNNHSTERESNSNSSHGEIDDDDHDQDGENDDEGKDKMEVDKETCSVCKNPFTSDDVTKSFHGVFCKGYIICSQKDCGKLFASKKHLDNHLNEEHTSANCRFGCSETILKPVEVDDHMKNLHDIIECFLCNIINSSGNFKNHLREKHSVNLLTYEKATSNTEAPKLYRLESNGRLKKQVLCNLCDFDITNDIKKFSFLNHYQNEHGINVTAILKNLDKNPIVDVIISANNSSKNISGSSSSSSGNNINKSKDDEDCMKNFVIMKSLDQFIESDFDTSQVYCIGVEHSSSFDKKPFIENDVILTALATCEFCNKNFEEGCGLYEHMTDSHGFRLLNVSGCEKCKSHKKDMDTDMSNDDDEESKDSKDFNLSLICPLDEAFCATKDNFKNHMAHEHFDNTLTVDKTIYKCLVCGFTYKSVEEIRNHFNTNHPEIKVKYCRICRSKLNSEQEIDHFSFHHAEDVRDYEKFCCKLCKKEFNVARKAKLHFTKSHKNKSLKKKATALKCQLSSCNEIFESKDDRKMHHMIVHPDEKLFPCKTCSLKFFTKSSLSSHNMIHKNIIFTCEFCEKTFLRRDSFKEHLLIHSDLRLKCSFCEKVFVQRSNLVRHERIHLNDKPYKCQKGCDKKFSDKGACTSHEKVHTREESSNCEVCGKHFARKQKLKYHMR